MFEFQSYTNGLWVHPIDSVHGLLGAWARVKAVHGLLGALVRVQIDIDRETGERRLTPVSGHTLERVPGPIVTVDSDRWEMISKEFFKSDINKSYTLLEMCGYSRDRNEC